MTVISSRRGEATVVTIAELAQLAALGDVDLGVGPPALDRRVDPRELGEPLQVVVQRLRDA